MNFLPSLSLGQWLLLLTVPPAIVALYFLKLRRRPLTVPSTYLWRKSIEDLHVNSLWQRIRRNLLMYLQLLLVGLVVFALLRPGWRSGQQLVGRCIFMIDNSASMNAVDVSPSRLAEAKRQALALIDEMPSGEVGMVVSFSDVARVEQGFTDNHADLSRAIQNIRPGNHSTDADEALRVAAGLASSPYKQGPEEQQATNTQPTKLIILSDGKFPPTSGISLANLDPIFLSVGNHAAENLGIIAFSVRRNEERGNRPQAFVSIENFGDQPAKTPVDLLHNGRQIDAANATIAPGETVGLTFDLGEVESGVLEARLAAADSLSTDDRAWAAVNAQRRPKVLLVTPGNEPLELALSTGRATELGEVSLAKPDVLQSDAYRKQAATGAYDLIIFDRCQPEESPRANTLYIAATPPAPSASAERIADPKTTTSNSAPPAIGTNRWWALGERVNYPQIIDMDRAHPLMQWLDLSDVDIVEAKPVAAPPGGVRLLDSNQGALLAIAPRDAWEDAVLGFEIYSVDEAGHATPNSNWHLRRSFPAFIFGVLSYLAGLEGPGSRESTKPGQPLALKNEAAAEHLDVSTPSGKHLQALRGQTGLFHFADTEELGSYEVRAGNQVVERFTVNLYDPRESDIRPAEENSIQIGPTRVEKQVAQEQVRWEFWKWLVLAALAVLVLEWYIYNQRLYV